MNIDKEIRSFGLSNTYSLRDLKAAFRLHALKSHPDVGGDRVEFEKAIDYFKILEKECKNFEMKFGSDVEVETKTVEGIDLYDLGKGYPITENAKTCEVCNGNGYKSFEDAYSTRLGRCDQCFGSGIFSYPCKKCHGTGKYSRNGKVIGECNLCKGSGRFYPENKNPIHGRYDFWSFFDFEREKVVFIPGTNKRAHACKKCHGSGSMIIQGPTERIKHHKCDKCDGIGEIKLFNPVLPRGFLAGNM